jgi:hypothetical protein
MVLAVVVPAAVLALFLSLLWHAAFNLGKAEGYADGSRSGFAAGFLTGRDSCRRAPPEDGSLHMHKAIAIVVAATFAAAAVDTLRAPSAPSAPSASVPPENFVCDDPDSPDLDIEALRDCLRPLVRSAPPG